MKFGAMIAPRIADWEILKYAEELGYDHGWVPDSQMIWSDCYAVLALAAANTNRIKLGTGVAIAPTRLAPVTAHSIASINQIAPGRVFLGIGTGHTAMRVMGMKPMTGREFRDYLEIVFALLNGNEVEYTHGGRKRAIRFLHEDMGFIDVEHRVPIYVAANGPIALRAAGEFGDGRISGGNEPADRLRDSLDLIQQGARRSERSLPDDFHTAALTYACVLLPGESLDSDRVIDEVGSMVGAMLHGWWERFNNTGDDAFVPDDCRQEWDGYLAYLDQHPIPASKRYQAVHEGHCTYLVPEERRFITPNVIRRGNALIGEPDVIIEQLHRLEAAGLKEVTLLPPMERARDSFREFAEQVIARY